MLSLKKAVLKTNFVVLLLSVKHCDEMKNAIMKLIHFHIHFSSGEGHGSSSLRAQNISQPVVISDILLAPH